MATDSFLDFLHENRFKEWVLNPNDTKLRSFWENWLSHNPHQKAEIEAFKSVVIRMDATSTEGVSPFSETRERALWQRIEETLEEETEENQPVLRPVFTKWWALAAVFLLLITASLSLFLGKNNKIETIQTAYGETRTMRLPDGSEVILNANSTLSFSPNWTLGKDREVTLKGEGYFIVNEQGTVAHRDRFIVHTPELDVEVLGTRFNGNTYRSKTQVVLQKGSVEIITKLNKKEKKYNLIPGQSAVFDTQSDIVNISKVNSEAYVGWKDKRFIFENTPLSEVAIMLENTYGLKVIINDKELADKQISGEIPISERRSLLAALSTLYALKLDEQSKDTLMISR
jgi:transmembrane sensor